MPSGPGPKVRCNHCQEVIQSMHRHDFRWCSCKKVAIDGGNWYLRLLADSPKDFTELDENGEDVRQLNQGVYIKHPEKQSES